MRAYQQAHEMRALYTLHTYPLTADDFAEQMGMASRVAAQLLEDLRSGGEIRRIGKKWSLTDLGRRVVSDDLRKNDNTSPALKAVRI